MFVNIILLSEVMSELVRMFVATQASVIETSL